MELINKMETKQKLKNEITLQKVKINNDLYKLQDMEKIYKSDILTNIYCSQLELLETMNCIHGGKNGK